MAESRLQRWSRKKAEASKGAELDSTSAPNPSPAAESGPSPEEQELIINEALPEQELLEKYGLPDPDAIELGTNIKGFLRKEIPELLRRRALRSLWKSNPVLAVLDGLNDYDEDFTNATSTGKAIQTLYKVGQGFDRTLKIDEQLEEQTQKQAGIPEPINPVRKPVREDGKVTNTEISEPEVAAKSSTIQYVEPQVSKTDAEAEPAPRYRPRMRFH